MGRKLSDLPLNPFEDNFVSEPRRAEPAVGGLNDRPLQRLIAQFGRLEAEPLPRRSVVQPLLKAQLVTSPEPGYGKSHLIGRLFHALDDRATLVYLRPFQDAGSAWRSLLLRLVQELDRPDDPKVSLNAPGILTQLDAFAHGVMAHLLAGLIESGRADCDDPQERAKELRTAPVQAFGDGRPGHPLYDWMEANFSTLLPYLAQELTKNGVHLHTPARPWLKALFAYAYGAKRPGQREASLEWFKGEGLSDEDAKLLALDANEAPREQDSGSHRNDEAHRRMEDFLSLAGFYRPFLFCLDQTEMFTSNPELCGTFGSMVEQLVAFGLNHMLVVTANQEPWTGVILEHMQKAYHHRFSEPIELEGIIQPQALDLVRQRLTGCDLDPKEIERFCDPAWLQDSFRDLPVVGVRFWLQQGSRRFSGLTKNRGNVRPEKTLEDYYRHYEAEVRSKANRLVFDPDILRWAMSAEVVGEAVPKHTSKPYKEKKGFFPIVWSYGDGAILLGFEDSCHWMRWQSILRETDRQKTHNAHKNKQVRALFFRTGEQRPVPGQNWAAMKQKLEEAKGYFTIRQISREELTTLYAAYDLFANVLEGNAPFERAAALDLIRHKLAPIWQSLLTSSPPPSPPPDLPPPADLLAQIRAIASAKHFLSLDQLLAQIKGVPTKETVLAGCQQIPEIHLFSTAQATALKWQSSPSA